MRNKRIRFLTYLLFIASLLMLVAPVIPHHHHDGEHTLCMKNDWFNNQEKETNDQKTTDEKPVVHICSCTQTDQTTTPTFQSKITPELYLVTIFLINPLLELISLQRKIQPTYFHYKEKVATQYIPGTTGLRAPPYFS